MGVRRSGFALIIVLVVSAAVFALAMEGGVRARLAVDEAAALRGHSEMRRGAESAAAIALAGLTAGAVNTSGSASTNADSDGATGGFDPADVEGPDIPELPAIVRDMLGEGIDEAKEELGEDAPDRIIRDRPGSRSGPDALDLLRQRGVPGDGIAVEVDRQRYRVHFVDQAGLLNLNIAPEEQVVRYLRAVGVAETKSVSVAHQLLDWRDEDDFVRPRGAEEAIYSREGIAIRNAPLRSVAELLFLPAMTRRIYERIAPDCTVVGEGRIHAGTAPREILLSVPDMTSAAADAIIALRRVGELTDATLLEALSSGPERRAVDAFRMRLSGLLTVRVHSEDRRIAPFVGTAAFSDRGIHISPLAPEDSYDLTPEEH